jgi:cytochrome P450
LASIAVHPKAQTRLRNEILMCDTDSPTMDQLNALPYLDKVIHESLRYHSVVGFVERVALQDDVIPVETPYKNRHGQMRDYIA